MKILIDMNLTPAWVFSLQHGGHEAVHWSSVGKSTASDHEIMEYALQKEFVVFTHDLDFPKGMIRGYFGSNGSQRSKCYPNQNR